ncbi:hypothetical protein [Agrobacterium rosae]|uniref:hypothetical protein n=1 Tax=Agrobacterium rosae TaxID=1972867 RepID=UPI00122ED585|nr:hypothetical protein [Agrobacterium rosae]KAA3510137.1 hypothetical protein DXM21_20115 [Agrobacterium rosae]KAA3514919.1 hypothetical protein DXM25_20255 [Agrobacterium rosae]MQB50758.1 hypothetical protein [Agrobacterium rosae]
MADFIWKGVKLKRLEEMLVFIAKVVDQKGSIAQPLLDRIESEYVQAITAQKEQSQSDRIQNLIGAKNATNQVQF